MLACVASFAIPAYLAFNGEASGSAVQTSLQSAVTAADTFARGSGLYSGISGRRLRRQIPGIDRHIGAVAVNEDAGYCLQDTLNGKVYDYVGGVPDQALAVGFKAATIQPGPCLAAVGIAAE